jgi:excisionase family DNA binding protein
MANERREIVPNAVYTLKEVEEILQVSDATMRRWLKEGKARSARMGRAYRFLGRQLLEMLESSAVSPAPPTPADRPRGRPRRDSAAPTD